MNVRFLYYVVIFSMMTGCFSIPPVPEESSCDIPLEIDEPIVKIVDFIKTTTEAFDLLKKDGDNILFVDVRTSAEASQGMPTFIDANIPIFEQKKELEFNQNFVTAVKDMLYENGLSAENSLIMICSEGTRSKRAVQTLLKAGYQNVYSIKGGVHAWQDSHLPWFNADEIDIDTLYFADNF